MKYAIIEAGGKQLWVTPGKFYDIHHISGEPGDTIKLNRILLVNINNQITIGKPCIQTTYVKATILKHIKNRKIIVFKMKAKKNEKKKNGHRQMMTRILIEQIVNYSKTN